MFIPRQPLEIDITHQDGIPVWTDDAVALHKQGLWLANALPLEVYNSKDEDLRALRNRIIQEIAEASPKAVKSPPRAKEALKTVLINLTLAHQLCQPVRYSRTRSNYIQGERYAQVFFKYDTLIPIIDALEALKYVEQDMGRQWYEDKNEGWQTRMMASPVLIELFRAYGLNNTKFYTKADPVELIVLNREEKTKGGKKKKVKASYADNKYTREMRKDLIRYNEFVNQHLISIIIPGNATVSYQFIFTIYKTLKSCECNFISGSYNKNFIKKKSSQQTLILLSRYNNRDISHTNNINHTGIPNHTNTISYTYHNNTIPNIQPLSPPSPLPITRMDSDISNDNNDLYELVDYDLLWFLSERYRCVMEEAKDNKKILSEEFLLKDIGISHLGIKFNREILHRVFNREDKSFKSGGRAFGAVYQRIPRHLRKYIKINNEDTIEIDFSAYHIRMLYHMIGIDYQDDPYIKCAGKKYRKEFKCASLVIINAKNENNAMGAIHDELSDNNIPLPKVKNPLRWIIDSFKEAHQPIAEFICSDYGVILQNIDSHIMNAILMSLMENGILGLSLYDSVIVARQYEDVLRETMTKEYEKVMGFKPVF